MLLRSPWRPRLAGTLERPAERLARAAAEDIEAGALRPGDRLPAHRDLAYQLKIGLGSVTKAYAALEQRGLVVSVRGRGMFVAGAGEAPRTLIDLSINAPPRVLTDRLLSTTLTDIARRLDAASFATYASPAGRPEHRKAVAGWLTQNRMQADAEALFLCNGAQHALSLALAVAGARRGEIYTESLTYMGAIQIAQTAGYRLHGLALDHEGLTPDGLEAALAGSQRQSRPIVYVTPTAHNPTGATMGSARRKAIVRVCRKYDALIVEDDVYALFAEPALPALASLAPERTLYIGGLSKMLSPGLRLGWLVVPSILVAETLAHLQATSTMAAPLAGLVIERWLLDGTVQRSIELVRTEAEHRHALARRILGLAHHPRRKSPAFHIWLPMERAAAEQAALMAATQGVVVTAPRAVLTDPEASESGVRLCLGVPTREQLAEALQRLSRMWQTSVLKSRAQTVMV
jgi:DNA-binding transcriptional MocR family regulator